MKRVNLFMVTAQGKPAIYVGTIQSPTKGRATSYAYKTFKKVDGAFEEGNYMIHVNRDYVTARGVKTALRLPETKEETALLEEFKAAVLSGKVVLVSLKAPVEPEKTEVVEVEAPKLRVVEPNSAPAKVVHKFQVGDVVEAIGAREKCKSYIGQCGIVIKQAESNFGGASYQLQMANGKKPYFDEHQLKLIKSADKAI